MTNSENNFMQIISKMAEVQLNINEEHIETLYEEVPVVNIQRSVQIVYSKDSARSIKAANVLNGIINSVEKASIVDSVYGFKITEVGDLLIKDVADVYIWLDLPKIQVTDNPFVLEKFEQSEHLCIMGHGAGPWVRSYFGEHVERFIASGGYMTKYMDDSSEPSFDLEAERTVHFGTMINAVNALSYAVPELVIPEVDLLIEYLSKMENSTSLFYSKQAKTKDVIYEFVCVNNAQVELTGEGKVLGFNNTDCHLIQRLADGCEATQKYHDIYKRVRDKLKDQGIAAAVGVGSAYQKQVAYTRIQECVWIARRIIAMSDHGMHNTRISAYGTHSTIAGKKNHVQYTHNNSAIQTVA